MSRSVRGFTTLLFALALLSIPAARAESPASKNKEGNRLFEQDKYQEAEKAYLDAEVQSPGRPELLYNLGNTLIKQKRYDQAVQSLRQAIGKGDRGLQESGWFNTGNALFDMGDYKDSVEAYIQALRINPADRDAKYNLEFALQKMKQQKQAGGGKSQASDSRQPSESSRQEKQNQEQSASQQQNQNKPANPQAAQEEQRGGSLSKEQALQILDALKDQELAEQRKQMEQKVRRNVKGKDW